jgi:hypothetical protein
VLVYDADHHATMRHLGVDILLQVSLDGIGEIFRSGATGAHRKE